MAKLSQVAFLGFGEAGQAIMSGWSENQAPIATAYDIKTDNPSLRKAKLTDYIESGVQGCFNLGAAEWRDRHFLSGYCRSGAGCC